MTGHKKFSAGFLATMATTLSLCALAATVNPLLAESTESKKATGETIKGLDLANMDEKVSPCEDFYKYANGTWMANTPIPPEYDNWGVLNIINDQNLTKLRKILDELARDKDLTQGSNEQKIADFYTTGMDEQEVEKAGLKPLQNELQRIDMVNNVKELQAEIARLHVFGIDAFFGVGSGQDFKDSTKVIGQVQQGGLGLPDRDYYFNKDEGSDKLREQYVAHVAKMFELMGNHETKAKAIAEKIMKLETNLAEHSMVNTDMRDPDKVYHKMSRKQLAEMTPTFSWAKYLTDLNHPNVGDINVGQPDFFKNFNEQLTAVPIEDWKNYLRWRLIDNTAPYLSNKFVDEDFNFHGKILAGKKEKQPRWKRVINATNKNVGEALGQLYVKQYFTPDAKAKALALVRKLKEVLREDLGKLEWMDPETRKNALAKLDKFGTKIGYPDKWRDYTDLNIDRASYAGNILKAQEFEFHRQMNKIGKPVDRTEWLMSPQTVNAYYWSEMNEIVFPAGILQPPIFDPKADDATNLGAMGMIIGHEMTHGFDDQGSKFDGQGNLKNWWSAADLKRFKERIALIEKQYGRYKVAGGTPLKGKLVAGEAAADLGGLTIAYKALEKCLGGKSPKDKVAGEKFTPEQKFFLSFAQAWASNIRPEKERLMALTDPHPTPHYRVNGTLANMDQFQNAFVCEEKCQMMLPTDQRCRLW